MTDRTYLFLGLAAKARKITSGYNACERIIKSGKAKLVILAEDASDNVREKFENMCKFRDINIRVFGVKELLGKFTGKGICSVIVVTDTGFARRLIEMIDERNMESGGGRIGKG